MNRLTIKELHIVEDMNKALNKLSQLEDLEEELGIDLITLFKSLKGEIYSLHPKTQKICLIIFRDFYFFGNQWIIECHSMEWNAEENRCDSWDCFLKDYGKTWALDKNDLVNDIVKKE